MAPTFELPFSLHYSDVSTSPSEGDDNYGDDLLSDFGGDDVKPFVQNVQPYLLTPPVIQPTLVDAPPADDATATKRRSRRPPSTAAKRATHNAIERARRESLNGRFLDLAKALPNMATVKRPSKSAIVIKSLEFVYQTQSREKMMYEQNIALRREVEELRARLGQQQTQSIQPVPQPVVHHHRIPSPPQHQTAFDATGFVQRSPVTSESALSPSSSGSSVAGLTPPPVELPSTTTTTTADYFANLFVAPTVNDFAYHPGATFEWAPVVPFGPPVYA